VLEIGTTSTPWLDERRQAAPWPAGQSIDGGGRSPHRDRMSVEELEKALVGTWELRSFEVDDGGGRRCWHPPATGLLLYGADGTMAVAINGRADPGDDPRSAMLFYAGRYQVGRDESESHGQGSFVEHHVRQSSDLLRLKKVLRREVLLEPRRGDTPTRLCLEGERPDGLHAWLTWERGKPKLFDQGRASGVP
jgi:hypothetical protein